MYLLGIDLGTSFIKITVLDAQSRCCVYSGQYPDREMEIDVLRQDWAEQHPDQWWSFIQLAIQKANASGQYNPKEIGAIGIAYQMHGLVLVDQDYQVIRPAILWCDSRALGYGEKASKCLGTVYCQNHLLNSPGNFTASKLAWVKENEPQNFDRIKYCLLPGDFIALRFTGECTTTPSALSEGIFWDFKERQLSKPLLECFGFHQDLFPKIQPVFSVHGYLIHPVAKIIGLSAGIPISYKAGDQLNNALSLNVMQEGEMAATAGTSGVIYQVGTHFLPDPASKTNTFCHLNYSEKDPLLGNLLCINGTGILYKWIKNLMGAQASYEMLNHESSLVPIGSKGLSVFPFGNGAERLLGNKMLGAEIVGINLNLHDRPFLVRAAMEGIAFSFRYGLEILQQNGMKMETIRAHRTNLFLSPVFRKSWAALTGLPLLLLENNAPMGASMGAGIGSGVYHNPEEAFQNLNFQVEDVDPEYAALEDVYGEWKNQLEKKL